MAVFQDNTLTKNGLYYSIFSIKQDIFLLPASPPLKNERTSNHYRCLVIHKLLFNKGMDLKGESWIMDKTFFAAASAKVLVIHTFISLKAVEETKYRSVPSLEHF